MGTQNELEVKGGAKSNKVVVTVLIVVIAVGTILIAALAVYIYTFYGNSDLQAYSPRSGSMMQSALGTSDSAQIVYHDCVCPFSSTRELSYADMADKSLYELRIARNEIYARHGYIFQDESLQKYFDNKSWYTPVSRDVLLSEVERRNVAFIESFEHGVTEAETGAIAETDAIAVVEATTVEEKEEKGEVLNLFR